MNPVLPIASGRAEAGMMPAIGGEDMGAAVRANINHVPTVDILVHFAGMFPVLEGFRRWAVLLVVSLLSMFRALSHALNSPRAYGVHYSICARPLSVVARKRNRLGSQTDGVVSSHARTISARPAHMNYQPAQMHCHGLANIARGLLRSANGFFATRTGGTLSTLRSPWWSCRAWQAMGLTAYRCMNFAQHVCSVASMTSSML